MVGFPWPMGDSHRYNYKGAYCLKTHGSVMMIIVLRRKHVSMCIITHKHVTDDL